MFRHFATLVMITVLGLSALAVPACTTTEAHPAALTGDTQEQGRHATGISSQINDY
jgi:hypothetical protein